MVVSHQATAPRIPPVTKELVLNILRPPPHYSGDMRVSAALAPVGFVVDPAGAVIRPAADVNDAGFVLFGTHASAEYAVAVCALEACASDSAPKEPSVPAVLYRPHLSPVDSHHFTPIVTYNNPMWSIKPAKIAVRGCLSD